MKEPSDKPRRSEISNKVDSEVLQPQINSAAFKKSEQASEALAIQLTETTNDDAQNQTEPVRHNKPHDGACHHSGGSTFCHAATEKECELWAKEAECWLRSLEQRIATKEFSGKETRPWNYGVTSFRCLTDYINRPIVNPHFRYAVHFPFYCGPEIGADALEFMLKEWNTVDVNVQDEDGNTPLHLAAQQALWDGGFQMLKCLLRWAGKTLDFHKFNKQGETLTHTLIRSLLGASKSYQTPAAGIWAPDKAFSHLQKLLDMDEIDWSLSDESGMTALHYVARYERGQKLPIFNALIKSGKVGDKNHADIKGRTPLHLLLTPNLEKNGDCCEVPELLKMFGNESYGLDWTRVTNDGKGVFHLVAAYDKANSIRDLRAMIQFGKCGSTFDDFDEYGWSPIHYLAQSLAYSDSHSAGELQELLYATKDEDGVIDWSIPSNTSHGDLGFVKIGKDLFDWSARTVGTHDYLASSVLHLAVKSTLHDWQKIDAKLMGTLLASKKCGDVNARDSGGSTPLHFAAYPQNEEAVDALLRFGANPDLLDGYGLPPVFLAATQHGCGAVVERLLSSGSKDTIARISQIKEPIFSRYTTLLYAVEFEDQRACRALLAHGVDVNVPSAYGILPLHRAAYHGNNDIVKMLLEHGADINGLCSSELLVSQYQEKPELGGNSRPEHPPPVYLAAARDNLDTVRILMERGAEIDSSKLGLQKLFTNILHAAIDGKRAESEGTFAPLNVLEALLNDFDGIDVNALDGRGYSAFGLFLLRSLNLDCQDHSRFLAHYRGLIGEDPTSSDDAMRGVLERYAAIGVALIKKCRPAILNQASPLHFLAKIMNAAQSTLLQRRLAMEFLGRFRPYFGDILQLDTLSSDGWSVLGLLLASISVINENEHQGSDFPFKVIYTISNRCSSATFRQSHSSTSRESSDMAYTMAPMSHPFEVLMQATATRPRISLRILRMLLSLQDEKVTDCSFSEDSEPPLHRILKEDCQNINNFDSSTRTYQLFLPRYSKPEIPSQCGALLEICDTLNIRSINTTTGRTILHILSSFSTCNTSWEKTDKDFTEVFSQILWQLEKECDLSIMMEVGPIAEVHQQMAFLMERKEVLLNSRPDLLQEELDFILNWIDDRFSELERELDSAQAVRQTDFFNHRDHDGYTPLHLAIINGNIILLKLLLNITQKVDERGEYRVDLSKYPGKINRAAHSEDDESHRARIPDDVLLLEDAQLAAVTKVIMDHVRDELFEYYPNDRYQYLAYDDTRYDDASDLNRKPKGYHGFDDFSITDSRLTQLINTKISLLETKTLPSPSNSRATPVPSDSNRHEDREPTTSMAAESADQLPKRSNPTALHYAVYKRDFLLIHKLLQLEPTFEYQNTDSSNGGNSTVVLQSLDLNARFGSLQETPLELAERLQCSKQIKDALKSGLQRKLTLSCQWSDSAFIKSQQPEQDHAPSRRPGFLRAYESDPESEPDEEFDQQPENYRRWCSDRAGAYGSASAPRGGS